MQAISRRRFLGGSAMGIASAGLLSPGARELSADPLGLPIGCQVYPVRQSLAKDFEGTLRQLAAVGYRMIEMCSESCHYQFRELKENLEDRIAYAKELGLKQMILSTFGLRRDATMADWTQAAGELNKIGERIQKAGLQLGFHNHNFEFSKIGGVLIYDELMSKFDPKLVKMQFQVSVISLGYEAATFLTKYPNRFISLHLQDWSPAEKKQVPIGQGVVDWPKLFTAARTGGVKNYFVEMNMDALKASVPYLHRLKV
jgi:sugar phosphate isomerase/epimerase